MKFKKLPHLSEKQLKDFFSFVPLDKNNTECHIWRGGFVNKKQGKNYGYFYTGRNNRWSSTRLLWLIKTGEDPGELVIRHKCDNPPCVNINHLEIGTYCDNNNDAISRNKHVNRFKDETVLEIRNRARQGENIHSIAADLNVKISNIKPLIIGTRYSHVKTPPIEKINDCWSTSELTKDQILEIKNAIKNNSYHGQKTDLAVQYGVTISYISKLSKGLFDHLLDDNVFLYITKNPKQNRQIPRKTRTERKLIRRSILSDEEVINIRNRISGGEFYRITHLDYPQVNSTEFLRIARGQVHPLINCPGVYVNIKASV